MRSLRHTASPPTIVPTSAMTPTSRLPPAIQASRIDSMTPDGERQLGVDQDGQQHTHGWQRKCRPTAAEARKDHPGGNGGHQDETRSQDHAAGRD